MRYLILLLLTIFLSNCATLDTLKISTPQGDKFQHKLFELYRQFAIKEAEQYDWIDSQHFINKAMAIAYGQESLPENPINWKIPNEHHSFAANYFNRLTYLLTRKDLRHKFPEQLASAQFNYDCWLEEQEENWQEDDINICKADLIKHVTFLEKHSQDNKTSTSKKITQPQKMEQRKNNKNITKKPQKIVQNEPKTTQKASKKARAPVHDMMQQQAKIFFEFNNTELNPAAKHNLDRILGGLEQADSVTLNSFTKIKGDEFHNMKLSRQRAMIVKDYLKNKGINDNKIDIFAYGEDEKSYNENNKHHSFVITLSD